MSDLVFVYGTLKRAYANSHLLRNAKFLGEATTQDKFVLFDCGFPVLMRSDSSEARQVSGEIFQITDAATWANLDRLEAVPRMYTRELITLNLKRDKTTMANVYVGNPKAWTRNMETCPVKNNIFIWEGQIRDEDDSIWENDNA